MSTTELARPVFEDYQRERELMAGKYAVLIQSDNVGEAGPDDLQLNRAGLDCLSLSLAGFSDYGELRVEAANWVERQNARDRAADILDVENFDNEIIVREHEHEPEYINISYYPSLSVENSRKKRLRNWMSLPGHGIKHLTALVGAKLTTTTHNIGEYYKDPEFGRRRKVGTVVGILAVSATAYLLYKANASFNTPGSEAVQPQPGSAAHQINSGAGHDITTSHSGSSGHHNIQHSPKHQQSIAVHEQPVAQSSLRSGETIASSVSNYLKHNHLGNSTRRVTAVTRWVLHHQHLTWEKARYLPVGYSFSMPSPHILHELLKIKTT